LQVRALALPHVRHVSPDARLLAWVSVAGLAFVHHGERADSRLLAWRSVDGTRVWPQLWPRMFSTTFADTIM
jgi:hypothetical protein